MSALHKNAPKATASRRTIYPYKITASLYLAGWTIAVWNAYLIRSPVHGAIIALGVLTVVLAPRSSVHKIRFPIALVPIVVWIIASRSWTSDPRLFSAEFIDHVVDAVVVACVAAVLPFETLIRILLNTFYGMSIFTWLYSMTHADARVLVAGTEVFWSWHGSFVHKNTMLMYLAFGVAAVVVFEKRKRLRHLAIANTAILVLASHSATGLATLGMLVAFSAWLDRYGREPILRRASYLLISMVTVCLAIGIGAISIPILTEAVGKDATFSGRTKIWSAAWWAIQRQPWRGYGLGGVFNSKTPITNAILTRVGFDVPHAHNGILELLLELGLIGLVLFIVYLTPLLVRGWRFVVNGKPQGKWIMIIVVGQLFISVSEPPYLLGFFSAIGLLYGATARYLSAGSVESGEEPLSASTIR
jgi:exopolysaccharide production protein ExoQ